MGFIPDPRSSAVHIGARWHGGQLTTLDDQPLPNIRDGAFMELVIPAWAILNEKDLGRLRSKRTIEMLPAEAKVWLGLSRNAIDPELHDQFMHVKDGMAARYLLACVILLQPLLVSVDGSARAKLNDCRCGIFVMNTEARSLNHAFTLLSQAFETGRLSHTGNVFRQGFICQDDRWFSLDDLRLARVMKALGEISQTAAAKSSLIPTR